jgi:hypothetical protein
LEEGIERDTVEWRKGRGKEKKLRNIERGE